MTEHADEDTKNDDTFGGADNASAPDNGFFKPSIDQEDTAQVGAEKYSFFGGFDDGDALELGGLEAVPMPNDVIIMKCINNNINWLFDRSDGVDAPPEEERLEEAGGAGLEDMGDFDPDLAGNSDLSFATMFAASLETDKPSRSATPQPSIPAAGGLPPPSPGLLDDPWGQLGALPGLSSTASHQPSSLLGGFLDTPAAQVSSQSGAQTEAGAPAGLPTGFGPLDPAVPPPQQGRGFLDVQPGASLERQQRQGPGFLKLPQQGAPPQQQQGQQSAGGFLPPQHYQQQQQQQPLQQAQDQLSAMRLAAPIDVRELEAQILRSHGGGAAAASAPLPPAPQPQPQAFPPLPGQQPGAQPLPPQQTAAAAAALYAAQRQQQQPPPPPRGYGPMAGGMPPPLPRGPPPPGWPRPPPAYLPGAPPRPGMAAPPGMRPPPGWPMPPRLPGMPPPPGHPPPPFGPPRGPFLGPHPGRGMLPGPPRPGFPVHQQAPRRLESKYMDADEIESILRIQWKSLHNGPPYVEDYYYQAYVNKHGAQRNARWFAPERIRELAPSERGAGPAATFVSLEGLGRIPFSNVRRPKPLMEVPDASPAGDKESEGEVGNGKGRKARRPLEQEPQLAARIMIEDCLALLLDVQDIDRLFAASPSGAPEGEVALRQRRALLLDGLAASLRLPPAPGAGPNSDAPAAAADRAAAAGDGVLHRLLRLRKGRDLLARALPLMSPPQGAHTDIHGRPVKVHSLALLFGLLRNPRTIFALAPNPDQNRQEDIWLGVRVASAAVGIIRRIDSPAAITGALSAIMSGDLVPPQQSSDSDTAPSPEALLPLYPPDTKAGEGGPWLAEVVAALLVRIAEVGPAAADAAPAAPGDQAAPLPAFFRALSRHLTTLQTVYQLAKEQELTAAADLARGMVPIPIIRAALPLGTEEQKEAIRATLASLT